MKFTFLTSDFYNDYPVKEYPQMELKNNRPYAHIVLNTYNNLFCIPLRSHILHPHAYFTNKQKKCGVDYSKAIIIKDIRYIDTQTKVYLRKDEYKKLIGKDFIIGKQFEKYIELYKRAKIDINLPHRNDILQYSTLQYFENDIL